MKKLFITLVITLLLTSCNWDQEKNPENISSGNTKIMENSEWQIENTQKPNWKSQHSPLTIQTFSIWENYEKSLVKLNPWMEDDIYLTKIIPQKVKDFYENWNDKNFILDNYSKKEKIYFWIEKTYNWDTYSVLREEKDFSLWKEYIVKKNGKELYRFENTFIYKWIIKNFIINQGNWWLLYQKNRYYSDEEMKKLYNKWITNKAWEEKKILVKNGEEIKNFDTFALTEFDWKIFYFFQKDKNSKISYFYDGKIYKTDFDEIIHDLWGSDENLPFDLQISKGDKMIFWANKNGKLTLNTIEKDFFEDVFFSIWNTWKIKDLEKKLWVKILEKWASWEWMTFMVDEKYKNYILFSIFTEEWKRYNILFEKKWKTWKEIWTWQDINETICKDIEFNHTELINWSMFADCLELYWAG